MTDYFKKYVNDKTNYQHEMQRILDKNLDFQTLIGAFDSDKHLDKIALYRDLTKEEVREFNEALDAQDINEAVKELADIFVVVSVYGKLQYNYTSTRFSSGETHPSIHKLTIQEEKWRSFHEVNTVSYLFEAVTAMSKSFNFNFLPYLEAVIDNNFDKLPLKSSVEDPEKDAKAIEELHGGRYSGVTYHEILDAEGNERYKFVDGNGKLMKPIGYETVNFKGSDWYYGTQTLQEI